MLRLARVCLVVLALAGTACSEERESGDPNQPAGKVIEMAGGVSAAREGAQARPLAVGAAVFADDTVTTGSDGSAVILLAHNQVRWNLGGDKSVRVDRSLAWKASPDQGGSAFDDEDEMATASAGRHTDREAGDTAATAQLPPAAPEPAATESAPAAPPSPPDTVAEAGRAPTGKSTASPPARRKMNRSASDDGLLADSKGDALREAPGGGATRSGGGGGAGVGRAAAAAAPVPPAPADAPSPAPEAKAAPKPSAGGLVLGKLTVKGPLTAAQVSPRLAGLGKGCRGTAAGTLTLRFDIDGKGAVVNVRLSGPSSVVAPVSSCLTAAARGLTFPAPAGGGTTAVEREIQVSSDK